MTRKLLRSLHLLALCAIALLAIPPSAFANETFSITAPDRSPLRPTGRVTLTLYLAPGVLTGSKVTIGGEDVLLDGGTTPLVNAPRTGDQVKLFTPAGTTQTVTLNYRLFSLFLGGKLCEEKGVIPGPDRTIAFSFTGPAITGYRLNSYIAPSKDFGCGAAVKRISSTAAAVVFDDGAKTNKGRHPLDVVLVLDQSGSMDDPPKPAIVESKWDILSQAVPTFIDQWSSMDAPVGTTDNLDDRLGVVLFESTATAPAMPFFVSRGPGNPDPHPWDPFGKSPIIPAADPPGTNMTALGKGVNLGIEKWTADPAHDATFIIMSDGMQNINPKIIPGGDTHLELLNETTMISTPLYDQAIPMETIYFGEAGGPGEAVLNQIAAETSGTTRTTLDTLAMIESFGEALVNALKGNTISLAAQRRGIAIASIPAGPLVPLVIDQSVQRVVFTLVWSGPSSALDVQLFPPGAPTGPSDTGLTPTTRKTQSHSVVSAFDLPAPGTWSVRVFAKKFAEPSLVPYSLSTHFVEKDLDYIFTFEELRDGTGQQMKVRAEVAYDGKPLAGLPPNAIQVHIQRPKEALGSILHDSSVNVPAGSGDHDPYNAKVAELGKNAGFYDRFEPKPVSTITLTDAGNGLYVGTFSDTSTPGLYRFDTQLDWTDPRTGTVHRQETLSRHVRVVPDAGHTVISTASGPNPGTVLVSVTPRDKFGNYVGPGYGSVVKAILKSSGTLVPGDPADPNQSGTYVFTVTGVPAGEVPDVDVIVDGDSVGNSKSNPPAAGGTWGVFLDAGVNITHGDFSASGVDGRFSINLGLERLLNPSWSVEGILGYHSFDVPFVSNAHTWQLSVNAKRWFAVSNPKWHPFLNGGAGYYRFDPGNTNKGGWNAGGGVLYDWSPSCGIEGVYNYHAVNSGGVDGRWSTLQLGIRRRF
jgi:hypothetical protein